MGGEGLVNFYCVVEPETEVEGIEVSSSRNREISAAENEFFGGEERGIECALEACGV